MNFISLLYILFVSLAGILTSFCLPLSMGRLRILFGAALGIVITTQLTLITSLLLGFRILSIIVALALYYVMLVILMGFIKSRRNTTGFFPLLTKERVRVRSAILTHWPLWFTFVTLGSLVVFVFWTKVLSPTGWGLITGGGGLWGDTALHSAYTMSIVEQGLPPVNPLFAGIPLIYPFLVNLFSATLVTVGMNLRFAFILPQLVYFLGFTTLYYSVARKLTGNRGAFFALLIFFLGWGLGFTEYVTDISKTGSLLPVREYTNNLPGYHLHNVLTGLIFPERSFLPGLFIGMLITVLCLDYFVIARKRNDEAISDTLTRTSFTRNDMSKAILIGFLLGILPLWHTHTFLFFGVAVGTWFIFNILFERQRKLYQPSPKDSFHSVRRVILRLLPTYGIASLLALPVFVWFGQQVSHESFIRFSPGWMDSRINPVLFWFKNTGLLIPLAIFGLATIRKQIWPFFLPAAVIFLVANFVIFQPWEWDNIKLFSWVFLFGAIATGAGLSRLTASHLVLKPVVLIIFITLTASGTLSLLNLLPTEYGIYSREDLNLAEWIQTNIPKNAVFLIDPWPNHPIPGLTGRSVYLGYPGHLWVHGIKYGEREALTNRILNGDIGALTQAQVPIDYLVADISHKSKLVSLPVVYENQKLVVFKVR